MATRSPLRRRAELVLTADARAWTSLTAAAVVVGCVLRLLRWLDDPALWLDESFLSINLIEEPLGDIFGPLQFVQSAPPAFLLVEKIAEMTLGDAEWSLRLFPLLASIASVVLFTYPARRLLTPPAATLAVALFAVGEPLLERAAEVKPYSVDVAVATLLLALTIWVVEAAPERIVSRAVVLGIVGTIALSLSFPAAFSLAAISTALVMLAWQSASRRLFGLVLVLGMLWLATFGVVYAIASSNVGRVSAAIFGGDEPSAVRRLDTVQDAWSTLVNPGGFDNGTNGLAALLALFGVLALARRATLHWLALLVVPLMAAGVGDVVNRYPLGGRFSLFLTPFLLLLVARGAHALVAWSRRPVLVAAGVGIFLAASPLALAAYHAARPPAREDVKPLLRSLVAGWRPGDTLYVYSNSQYALRYYSTCSDCEPSRDDFPWPLKVSLPAASGEQFASALESVPPAVIVGRDGSPLADVARLPSSGRVWLLFSHVISHDRLDDELLLLEALERDGEVLEDVRARGARLYLVERGRP